VTAWSFSRLYTYRRCPAWFKYQNLDKIPQPPVPAMERGSALHTTLEKFIKQPAARLPASMKLIAPQLRKIRKLNPRAELELAFDERWKKVDWFAPTVRLRIKIDLLYEYPDEETLWIIDYKSGRIKPEEHQEQLRLYKLAALLTEPKATSITTGVWYIDHESVPRPLSTTVKASFGQVLTAEKAYWTAASARLVRDKRFAPTPGSVCNWCPYSWRKQLVTGGPGPCQKAI
jgi:RecB family exonuclease